MSPISPNRPGGPQESPRPARASEETVQASTGYTPRFADPVENVAPASVAPEPTPVAAPTSTPAPAYAQPEPARVNTPSRPTLQDEPVQDEYSDLEPAEAERMRLLEGLSEDAKDNARRLLMRIADDESSEVLLNGPKEILYKISGQRRQDNISFDDVETYHTVINTLILHETDTEERIGSAEYLIEGQLTLPNLENDESQPPTIARVHVIAPPVVKTAKVTIAKKAKKQFRLDDLAERGAMSPIMTEFMKALARGRATVVFSGLSGSGKTTLLEAMSHHFDMNERVVIAEDTAELRLPVPDIIPLLSTSRRPGQNLDEIVTLEWLVAQANRMRPDRIIVGEVRGGEMAEFLAAANSGADGSMTTVHASSSRQTIDKIVSLSMKSATAKNEVGVLRDIASTVQIIVQTALIDGRHIVKEIAEVDNVIVAESGTVQMTPLFQYDPMTRNWKTMGRPSERMQSFLAQRGVEISPNWFRR